MIIGAKPIVEYYGQFAVMPGILPSPVHGIRVIYLSEVLKPFIYRRVRVTVWDGGFDPVLNAVARVEWDTNNQVAVFDTAEFNDVLFAGEVHVEVKDLSAVSYDIHTLCYRCRPTGASFKVKRADNIGGSRRPIDFAEDLVVKRISQCWAGKQAEIIGVPGVNIYRGEITIEYGYAGIIVNPTSKYDRRRESISKICSRFIEGHANGNDAMGVVVLKLCP